jgi:putative hydrolase of the HAD superfamily
MYSRKCVDFIRNIINIGSGYRVRKDEGRCGFIVTFVIYLKKMIKYRHLFFDLDRTLWDYDTNAEEALEEIFETFDLLPLCKSFRNFHASFIKYNDILWEDYREGRIQKDLLRVRRFELLLQEFGSSDTCLAEQLNEKFLNISPYKSRLIPGAMEALRYLKDRKYRLYILTNGFTRIQTIKIESSGLDVFFEKMFTCENTNSYKPKRAIFEYALSSVHARKGESLMIGDDLKVDIVGASDFGIDQVFFNPERTRHNEKVTYEIRELTELMGIL